MTETALSPIWSHDRADLIALEALHRLRWSVFPLDAQKMPPQTGGMHPNRVPKRLGWKAYQTRLPTPQEVTSWQRRYTPSAWAIITGSLSGVLILDFDDERGRQTRERLGLHRPHVQTGSGGHHVYFRHPGWMVPTLNSKSKKALGHSFPGLDIRADGGYAAFCGQNTNGAYLWLRAPDLEDISLLPEELRAFLGLLHAPDVPAKHPPEHSRKLAPEHAGSDLMDRLIAKYVGEARTRGRNNAGFDLACQLRDNDFSEAQAETALRDYARRVPATNTKGEQEAYTEQEALLSVQSAFQKGARAAWSRSSSLQPEPSASNARPNGNGRGSGNGTGKIATASEEPPERNDGQDTHPYAHLMQLPAVPLPRVLTCLKDTEWGDANLFAHLFVRRVVYDHAEKKWYLYQGHYWQRDVTLFVKQLVAGVLASVYLRAAADLNLQIAALSPSIADNKELQLVGIPSEEEEAETQQRGERLKSQVKALSARATGLRTSARMNNVLSVATSRLDLSVTSDIWDAQPWLLGTRSGMLDLQTGTLRPGRAKDYMRTVIPTPWRGLQVPAPRFEQYLQEIFADRDEQERGELITFLQRVLGYGISGNVNEHVFLMLFGEKGRNGKDTLMSILYHVLGEAAGAVSNDVVIASSKLSAPGSAKPHLCSLQGKRIAWASETDKGARFDVAQVKFLTGGGDIPARHLYGEDFIFAPSHLLILLTNNKPHADAGDDAFWERLCPITFNMRFVDQPSSPNERKKDIHLIQALQEEASGILAWLVRGCLEWQHSGLQIPESVLRERKIYRGEEDTLGQFIEECCVTLSQAKVKAKLLYERYLKWMEENRLQAMTGTTFGREMGRRYRRDREKTGFYYYGIGLLAETEPLVKSGEPFAPNYSPPRELASQANGEGVSEEGLVNPLQNYSPPRELASQANGEGVKNASGEGYEPFCEKLKPQRDSIGEILLRERVHTIHQSAAADAINQPVEPMHEAVNSWTKGSPDEGEEQAITSPVEPMHEAVNSLGQRVHQGSPISPTVRCTTKWEKQGRMAHEAKAVEFRAGYWWCAACRSQWEWMELGEQHHYPACAVLYHKQTIQVTAGRDAWLQFACESGHDLVWNAVNQFREQCQKGGTNR